MTRNYATDNDRRGYNYSLACIVGEPQAIVYDTIYQSVKWKEQHPNNFPGHYFDGRWWMYSTYTSNDPNDRTWETRLGYRDERTIRDYINKLVSWGIVLKKKPYASQSNHTLYYAIHDEHTNMLLDLWDSFGCPMAGMKKHAKAFKEFAETWQMTLLSLSDSVYQSEVDSDAGERSESDTGERPGSKRVNDPDLEAGSLPASNITMYLPNNDNNISPAGGNKLSAFVDDESTENSLSLAEKEIETDTLQKRKALQREKSNTPTDTDSPINNSDYRKQDQIIANGKILLFDSATNSYAYIGDVDPSGNETYRKTPKTGYDRNGNKRGGFGSRKSEAQECPARFMEKPAREVAQKEIRLPQTPLEMAIVLTLRSVGNNKNLANTDDIRESINMPLPNVGLSIEQIYAKDPARFTAMMESLVRRLIPDDGIVSKQYLIDQLALEVVAYLAADQPRQSKSHYNDTSKYGY